METTPSPGVVTAAIEEFVHDVTARRVAALASLAPPDGDAAGARDFLAWLAKTDGVKVESVVSDDQATAVGPARPGAARRSVQPPRRIRASSAGTTTGGETPSGESPVRPRRIDLAVQWPVDRRRSSGSAAFARRAPA